MAAVTIDGVNAWRDKDGNLHTREFEDTQLHDGTPVRAHVVTDDTAGEVNTMVGAREVRKGDVLVESDRPGQYDVYNADMWSELTTSSAPTKDPVTVDDSDDDYEPSDHTAREVREFLSREDLDDENRVRVIAAERSGRNRGTAIPPQYRDDSSILR